MVFLKCRQKIPKKKGEKRKKIRKKEVDEKNQILYQFSRERGYHEMPPLYHDPEPGEESELRPGEESEALAARIALGRTMEHLQVWLLPKDSLLLTGIPQPLERRRENDGKWKR